MRSQAISKYFGSISIPMMKKMGYPGRFAASVEPEILRLSHAFFGPTDEDYSRAEAGETTGDVLAAVVSESPPRRIMAVTAAR